MNDQKTAVTDEMVSAARVAWQEHALGTGCPSINTTRRMLTAALDAAPTTDPAHDIDWHAVAERHEDTIKALVAERDEAIAHDRQPYPTASAYEAVCAALMRQRARAKHAEAERDRLYALVADIATHAGQPNG